MYCRGQVTITQDQDADADGLEVEDRVQGMKRALVTVAIVIQS